MFTWAAGIGAGFCLAYYILIVIYAGFSVSFSWFWLLAAGLLGALSWGSRYCRLHPKQLPLWLPVSVMTLFAASAAVLCAVSVFVFLGAATPDTPGLDYVIVLGAQVRSDGISNSLKQRLDKALEYNQESPGTVFILSGGQGKDEPETEAQAMYDYLSRGGIPVSRLVMESASRSTVENIAYSSVVIDRIENGKKLPPRRADDVSPGPYLQVEEKPVRIGILTSSFHVYRATKIAKKRGMENVCGIAAHSDALLFLHLCVRECAAILKDRLMGNM